MKVEWDDNVLMLILKVQAKEATDEDLQRLQEWCHKWDASGALFLRLLDPVKIKDDTTLLSRIKQLKDDSWRRITTDIWPGDSPENTE